MNKPIVIASRGSALALVQANFILSECRRLFPELAFELNIIKTTGDKLQSASMARIDATLPRGLFTKEIEEALLANEADLAVHSLKDLPTILPDSLKLGATTKREDVRDVLIRRGERRTIQELAPGATIATSSTRRRAQLLHLRPDLQITEIRGNVGTRLQKLSDQPELDGTILAAAGLKRLGFRVSDDGTLSGEGVPAGLKASFVEPEQMLPCVGQAALGIEVRENDELIDRVCQKLNDTETWHCVTAERSFLRALGGGCQSAVGAFAKANGATIHLRAVSFLKQQVQHVEGTRSRDQATALGEQLAAELLK